VSSYHTVSLFQTFSGMISGGFWFKFRSSIFQKVSIKNYARFSSCERFSLAGTKRILWLVDDQSGSDYTLAPGFTEYLPSNGDNVKVSIWNGGYSGSCLNEQYCLFENDVFKINPSSSYSFEVNGHYESFILDLSIEGLRLFNEVLNYFIN
jgi:hypothetical protein